MSTIDSGAAEELGVSDDAPGTNVQKGVGPGGPSLDAFVHQFDAIELSSIEISNPTMLVLKGHVLREQQHGSHLTTSRIQLNPVTIGMGILKKFHFYIAYGERKIYFTPA